MGSNNSKSLSIVAFTISVLPLAALVPGLVGVHLLEGVRMAWALANVLFVILGLLLSIICLSKKKGYAIINRISAGISSFWLPRMAWIRRRLKGLL